MTEQGNIESYGINAVCTHLGCVVPWNKAENKFKCPCHGSQYNNEGKVIRGPAPLSLALAHADINDSDTIIFSPGPRPTSAPASSPGGSKSAFLSSGARNVARAKEEGARRVGEISDARVGEASGRTVP